MHIAVGMIQSVYKNEVNVCLYYRVILDMIEFQVKQVSGLTGCSVCVLLYIIIYLILFIVKVSCFVS